MRERERETRTKSKTLLKMSEMLVNVIRWKTRETKQLLNSIFSYIEKRVVVDANEISVERPNTLIALASND